MEGPRATADWDRVSNVQKSGGAKRQEYEGEGGRLKIPHFAKSGGDIWSQKGMWWDDEGANRLGRIGPAKRRSENDQKDQDHIRRLRV